jgi:disulfide bond formation protein DsbB
MRNLPGTPIIFLVYSPKSYFLAFFGAILIAISEIISIKQCTDRNYVHKHAYLGSDWTLRTPCVSVTQVALTGMRVVTQDFGRKSKLTIFGRNPSCSYVKPVVTRGSTVQLFNCRYRLLLSDMFRLVNELSSGCWKSSLLIIKCYTCFNSRLWDFIGFTIISEDYTCCAWLNTSYSIITPTLHFLAAILLSEFNSGTIKKLPI